MSTLLIRNAEVVITNDENLGEVAGGSVFIKDNVIQQVGLAADLPAKADKVIDASGMAVMPGLVNTHHHFYQTLTRAVPGAQDQKLFDWLVRLYPIWGEMDSEAVYVSTLTAMAELILSGCTTAADHLYLTPNGSSHDDQVRAAQEIGMRFQLTRGSMSLGRSQGGLPPDHVCDSEEEIIKDSQRIIETYHDSKPYSMLRVTVAPCSPFSVTPELMKESAHLARAYEGVTLHTHVAETQDEVTFCMQKFGMRPAPAMESLEWVGPEVWWAHSIWVNTDEMKMMAETGTGVAHCPSSNMRLGSGICPVDEMLKLGVKVGLAVDGSASNDSSHMFTEARNALLLQRVKYGAGFSVRQAFEIATKGGAAVMGRNDIGVLKKDMAADVIGVDLNSLNLSGAAVHDPLAALLLCTVDRVSFSVINGKVVAQDGQLVTLDLEKHIPRHNEIARKMVSKHPEPERYKLV